MSITFLLILWLLVSIVFFHTSSNFLFSLILLELLTIVFILFYSLEVIPSVSSDYYLLSIFALFVIEGVMGLAGFILLVVFSGSDYTSSASFLN